ncbi:MAG: GNAT family N-acetyltransferase [Aristaeellaceae bacterium]
MQYEAKKLTLKDGREAVLRVPTPEDAPEMLRYLVGIGGETEFVLAYPEERQDMTVEQEAAFIRRMVESDDVLFLVCEVEGQLAGCCQVDFNHRMKTAHRASVGVGLWKAYWSLGIGTAMFEELIAEARRRSVMLLELEFIEGNSRARALYEKMGFRVTGMHPDAIRLRDGSLRSEYLMQLRL